MAFCGLREPSLLTHRGVFAHSPTQLKFERATILTEIVPGDDAAFYRAGVVTIISVRNVSLFAAKASPLIVAVTFAVTTASDRRVQGPPISFCSI